MRQGRRTAPMIGGNRVVVLLTALLLVLGLTALTTTAGAGAGDPATAAKKKKKKKCPPGKHRVVVKKKNGEKKNGKKKTKCVPNAGKPDEDDTTQGASVARLTISPQSATFPNTVVNDKSAQAFTVTNTGGSASTVPSVSITELINPGGPTGFAVTADSCSGTALAPGATCIVSVQFQPSNAQQYGSILNVTAAVGGNKQAGMVGTGVTQAKLTISPASFTFPPTKVGHQSDAQEFTVTNGGGSPSGVPSVTIAETNNPGNSPGFIFGNGCTVALAPGASCQVRVRFTPTSSSEPQPYTAVLHVAALRGGDAQAQLTGTGIP